MTEYEQQAKNFLRESGAKMRVKYVEDVLGFPFDKNDKYPHRKYSVTLTRNGKSWTFPFYDSYANFLDRRKRPTHYDILACLTKYDVGDMGDFVQEFGYEIVDSDSFRRVEKIWKAVKDEYKNLLMLFGEDLMEKLAEIN